MNTENENGCFPEKEEDLFEYAMILAGGKSSRMGFDKQLLKTENDISLAVMLAEELKQVFGRVIVVTNTPELYEGKNLIICQDIYPGQGPMAGIHSAFRNTDAKSLFVLACDMTSFAPEYAGVQAKLMLEAGTEGCFTIAEGRMETFHAFYSRALLSEMEQCLKADNNGLNRFLRRRNVTQIPMETAAEYTDPQKLFRNLNTPDEYRKFREETRQRNGEKYGTESF